MDGGFYKTMSVKVGAKLFIHSGSCSGVVTAESGGYLTVSDGGINHIAAKAGSTLTISNGNHTAVTIEENAYTVLSGGSFGKISVAGKSLIDCLAEDCAFVDNADGKIMDGRSNEATNVHITVHTHTCSWKTDTHEKSCDCGYVEEVDNEPPTVKGITHGETYYGRVSFTVSDKNRVTVKENFFTVLSPENGRYKLEPDNRSHILDIEDEAGNKVRLVVLLMKLYSVTVPTDEGYVITDNGLFLESKTTVGHGQTYAFKLIVRNGYSETDSYAVKANGKTLVPQTDEFGAYIYTVPNVQENLVITVAGVADITPPAAELRIGTNKFHSFMHAITFGRFFRQTQTVTVTASDNGSGISRVEYLLSETAFADRDAITGSCGRRRRRLYFRRQHHG